MVTLKVRQWRPSQRTLRCLLVSIELVENVAKESISLINTIRDLDPNDRIDKLKQLGSLLTETLKRGEEKVALAKTTFDAVCQ